MVGLAKSVVFFASKLRFKLLKWHSKRGGTFLGHKFEREIENLLSNKFVVLFLGLSLPLSLFESVIHF